MKILYLKGYKWLFSQNQRNDLFDYRQYKAFSKHIKPFLKKNKVKGRQCLDYNIISLISYLHGLGNSFLIRDGRCFNKLKWMELSSELCKTEALCN